jgi:plasmid stabilization system protein ParE
VKLRYTRRAAAELDAVLCYIDERSPQGAHAVKTRIHEMIALLLQQPLAGHHTSKSQLRRMVVYPYPYLILHHRVQTTGFQPVSFSFKMRPGGVADGLSIRQSHGFPDRVSFCLGYEVSLQGSDW